MTTRKIEYAPCPLCNSKPLSQRPYQKDMIYHRVKPPFEQNGQFFGYYIECFNHPTKEEVMRIPIGY